MSVIRVVHNKENPYVQLNKEALWDERLSLKAIGLWARCMSRPDNWRFNIQELVNKCKEGRRAVDSTIHELIEFGYAVRLEHWDKSDDGKFTNGGVEYVFFEFPVTEEDKQKILDEFKKSFRHCCFSNCRDSNRRNDQLLKKEEEVNKEKRERDQKEEGAAPPPSAPPLSLNFSKNDLTKSQDKSYVVVGNLILDKEIFYDLILTYGKQKVMEKSKQLDDYSHIKPESFAEYKCHARVLRDWLRRDKEEAHEGKSTIPPRTALNDLGLINELLCYPDIAQHKQIEFRGDSVEITSIERYTDRGREFERKRISRLVAGQEGFKECIEASLRKMNLPIPWLKKG